MAMNDHKYNDIEQDEEMENEEYANEKEKKRVRRQSLVKVVGGLLLFGSGVVVGAASNEMIINDANNRELNKGFFEALGALVHNGGGWVESRPDAALNGAEHVGNRAVAAGNGALDLGGDIGTSIGKAGSSFKNGVQNGNQERGGFRR